MYDVKIYEDGREHTIRNLSIFQASALQRVLDRHSIKHTVKRLTQRAADESHVALNGTFRCPECQCMDEHNPICSRR